MRRDVPTSPGPRFDGTDGGLVQMAQREYLRAPQFSPSSGEEIRWRRGEELFQGAMPGATILCIKSVRCVRSGRRFVIWAGGRIPRCSLFKQTLYRHQWAESPINQGPYPPLMKGRPKTARHVYGARRVEQPAFVRRANSPAGGRK